jgi:hypothetical protein
MNDRGLNYEEQYRTDGEAHNYSGPIEDERFAEYPRYGKNLNRDRRSRKNFSGIGPKGYRRSDVRIEEEICEKLARDKYINASEIEVSVKDAIVTLAGSVEDREDRFLTEMLVEETLGVEDIRNDIRVRKQSSRDPYLKEIFEPRH